MNEKWGFTKNWKHRPDLGVPELYHEGSMPSPFPQQVGFEDEKGETHLIGKLMAIALGLIGIADVKDEKMSWTEYRNVK